MTRKNERWARLGQLLWQPPRPHGEQPRERTVGPLELFYDLVVVVLVAQAAQRLAEHLTWAGLREFAAVFTLTWIAWLNGSLHHELHGREDARGRSVFLLQILVLVPLGAFIPEAGGARGAAFAVDAAILFAVLAVLWQRASRGDSAEYRRPSRLFVAGTAACVVVLAVTAAMPDGSRVVVWLLLDIAYLAWFGAVVPMVTPAQAAALTITDSLIDRFSQFIIIVLGETVTGVVAGLADAPVSAMTIAVGLVAIVVGFGAWWTYFDFVGSREPRAGRVPTMQWMLSYLPLTCAVAAMGAAMVGLVEHAHAGRTQSATAWLLCGGTAVALCSTTLLMTSLRAWRDERELLRPLARACVATAALCIALGALRPSPLLIGMLLVVLLSIPWGIAVSSRLDHPDPAEA